MSAYEDVTKRLQPPCPLCQGMTFSWGRVSAHGASSFTFVADDQSGMERFLGLGEEVVARMCEACGNVQFFRRDRVQF